MNDSIDWQALARRLLRRWPIVVVLVVVGVIVGWTASLVLPPRYVAETTVVVTTPKLRTDFDSRFRSTLDLTLNSALNKTLINLVRNQELEARVIEAMDPYLRQEEKEPGGLLPYVQAVQIGGDTSYFKIKAHYSDAGTAKLLADTWAAKYVDQINEIYGMPPTARAEVAASLEAARTGLRAAEDELQQFQEETGMGLVDNVQYASTLYRQAGLTDERNLFGLYERYGASGGALESKNAILGQYLVALDTLNLLIERAETLLPSANARGSDLPLGLLDAHVILAEDARLQSSSLAAQSVSDVYDVLTRVAGELDATVDLLQSDVDETVMVLAERHRYLAELIRTRQLAEESYIIMSLKLAEIDTASGVEDSWMQLVSMAQLPDAPVSPSLRLNVLVGALIGLLMGVLAALVLTLRSGVAQGPDGQED